MVLCIGMTGAVLLTMFGYAINGTILHTDGDDPELDNSQKAILAFIGIALILWALVVAPFTSGFW